MRLWFLTTNAMTTTGTGPASPQPPPTTTTPGHKAEELVKGRGALPPPQLLDDDEDKFVDVELGEQSPSTLMKPSPGQGVTGRRAERWFRGLLVVAGWLSVVALLVGTVYLFWLVFSIAKGVLELVHQ